MEHRIETVACPGCGAAAPAGDLCPGCGRLQSFPAGLDHWAVLGLERRLDLDRADLEQRVHRLNRRFHPDYFRLRSPEEQATSLGNSAAVNAAYRTLRDPVARVEYLLELEGLPAGQGKPPADLFEEILEVQEARLALATADQAEAGELRARLEAARQTFAAWRERTEAELTGRFAAWDAGDGPSRRRLLEEMRDILGVRAYLRTVLRDLEGALTVEPAGGLTH
jgi:molecular chaperone HscB